MYVEGHKNDVLYQKMTTRVGIQIVDVDQPNILVNLVRVLSDLVQSMNYYIPTYRHNFGNLSKNTNASYILQVRRLNFEEREIPGIPLHPTIHPL